MDINQKVSSFMDDFLETPEPILDNEYFELEERYNQMFGHSVPRAMLPDSITTVQIKEALTSCLERGEDILFEFLGVEILDEVLY